MNYRSQTNPKTAAFTLIELLTVIAIIGILAAILIPVVGRVRDSARTAQCVSNLRQLSTGYHLYANDNGGRPIDTTLWTESRTDGMWPYFDLTWLENQEGLPAPTVFTCPGSNMTNPSTNRWAANYSVNRNTTRANDGIDNNPFNGRYFLKNVEMAHTPSQLVKFADGIVSTARKSSGGPTGYLRPLTTDTPLNSASWHFLWPHGERVNIVFLDGHVERFAEEDFEPYNDINSSFWQQTYIP